MLALTIGACWQYRFSIATLSLEDLAEGAFRARVIESVSKCTMAVGRRALLQRTFQVQDSRILEGHENLCIHS